MRPTLLKSFAVIFAVDVLGANAGAAGLDLEQRVAAHRVVEQVY